MVGSFACPECGAGVTPPGRVPGRQVRCPSCGTLVEVPFFPRRKSQRRQRPRWSSWLLLGFGALCALVLAVGAGRTIRRWTTPPPVQAKEEQVPRLTRAQAEAWLAESDKAAAADPERGARSYQALLAQLRGDVKLADVAETARERLDGARRRWAERDLAQARRIAPKDPGTALLLCEQVTETAANLQPGTAGSLPSDARAVVERIAAQSGSRIAPVQGQFTLGVPRNYDRELAPRLADALRAHGYLPIDAGSPFQDLWAERAPYTFSVELLEGEGGFYLHSHSRITYITAHLTLSRGGAIVWETKVSTRTQVPLPNLSAQEAAHLARTSEESAALAERFYKDAHASLLEKLAAKLQEMPKRSE